MKYTFAFLISFLIVNIAFSQLTPAEYAKQFSDMAVRNMKESGVPASITLAQGILESASGNSRLARKGNNHFGIKCHGWEGETIYADDDAKNECFRKYNSAYESYRDHAEFLSTRGRYSFLFDLDITDYRGWAHGLSRAGYATDPQYPQKLISIIERYELHIYDTDDIIIAKDKGKVEAVKPTRIIKESGFVINPYIYEEFTNNNIPYVYAKEGDNIDKLADELDLMRWQIRRYNDLDRDSEINEGDIIYLKPKRRRAAQEHETHVVQEGETMVEISQMYGVRLRRLYRMNKIEQGSEVPAGTELNLRRVVR